MEQLQQIYPGYFENLSHEIIMTGKAAGEYNKLRSAILNAARARAAQKVIDENAEKFLSREIELKNQRETIFDNIKKGASKGQQTIEIGSQYFKVSEQEAKNYYAN